MKIVMITGAAKGIGYHIALEYARLNYKVIAMDILERKYEDSNIEFHKVDLSKEDEIINVFKSVKEKYGRVHILINNGAISKFNKNILDTTMAEFDSVINVNLRGSYICCREFIKANKGEAFGRIINIASTRWNQNEANWEAYGASKGGLVSLTNTLAVSLCDTNITVNAVSPGWIQVDDYNTLTERDHKQHPSGRVGKPKDIINACLFLSNEENDFINGANIVVDGGMTKKMIYETSEDFWSE